MEQVAAEVQAGGSGAGAPAAEKRAATSVGARRNVRGADFTALASGGRTASQRATLVIPVRTSPESLRVVLHDERGAARVVPVRTVSFGAQELVAREGSRTRPPLADKEGVW